MSASVELRVDGLVAGYGPKDILHGVTASARAGEVVGLIGPNGAGKTTLLRALSGLLAPRAGSVRLDGQALARVPARERARRIAFVPQTLSVPVPFRVEELVAMGRSPHVGSWAPLTARDHDAVARAIDMMELGALRAARMPDLSAGEFQRAVVAMALAQEPSVLLLDEPTAHLDLHHGAQLMRRVAGFASSCGLAVVLTSHDLGLAASSCSRLLLLSEGRIAAEGRPEDVLQPAALAAVYHHPLSVRREAANWWIRAE